MVFKIIDLFLIICLLMLFAIKELLGTLLFALVVIQIFILAINVWYILSGKRLNFYFTFSKQKNNTIEVHYNPVFFIHFITKETFLQYHFQTFKMLKEKYPKYVVYARTMTTNKIIEREGFVIKEMSKKNRYHMMFPSVILTITNLKNICTLSLSRKLYLILFLKTNVIQYRKEDLDVSPNDHCH